ncbi:MAG: GntR family transcriptional regulator [Lawsonibacter sp.]|nr:GntR family transcriptional regulator [Lawsonibacter sp.]
MTNETKKPSRAEVAYHILKDRIMSNQAPSGTLLSEVALTKELNMSRTPIREALKILESEDLVEIIDGVGSFVKKITEKDIEDAYAVRQVLEIFAAQTAITAFTAEELDSLEERFRLIQRRLQNGEAVSIEEFTNADWALHDQLLQKSGNRYAQAMIDNLSVVMRRYQALSVRLLCNTEKSLEEHLGIIECIRRRDLDNLTALLKNHIQY